MNVGEAPTTEHDPLDAMAECLSDVLHRARALGANAAEAALNAGRGLSVTVRRGEVDTLQHHTNRGLVVTVYFGSSKGTASSGDWTASALDDTVRAACNIARNAAADPCAGLPDAQDLEGAPPDLELDHPWALTPELAIDIARRCERAALDCHQEIHNSDGATLSSHRGQRMLANTNGFLAGYPATRHSLACHVIGEREGKMQRGNWYSVARCPEALQTAEHVGLRAAERAFEKLGARRIDTRSAAVLFAPEAARGLVGHFVAAAGGANLYRRSSFLLDRLGGKLFPSFVRLTEQPHLHGGLGSAPFDAEGVATRQRDIVSDGVLRSYVLNSYSARRLGMATTGNAGGVHNLILEPGPFDREAMLKKMGSGLAVTELMGQGINLTTGDYSRGASGFWVEDGEIAHPVEEITVAGNLLDMFRHVVGVGQDVDERGNIRCGSILVDEMTIGGS